MTSTQSFSFEDVHYFKFGYSPLGKPFLFTYIYFIDGLLIDTGQSRMRKHVLATIPQLNVDQIFITHHHEDHSGNITELKNQFNCPVFAPSLCCEIMKSPPPLSLAQKLVWGGRPPNYELIPKDDLLQTRDHQFSIIPIPGHAEDMVALYEPDKKWIFSSDLYINSYIGYFMREESLIQQIQSIKKILALDFEVLFCSHNPRLNDGRDKLLDKLHYLEEFYEKVTMEYQKGYTAKEIYEMLKLKEHGITHILSNGQLSKLNMVRSAIRDFRNDKQTSTSTEFD